MDNRGQSGSILKLVNLARAAYGAPELKTLLGGQPHSASFCSIGRSLRSGVEDWLFVAVGTRHLRLWALGKDSAAIARLVMTAWGITGHQPAQSRDKSGCVTFPLQAPMQEFINQFDHGLLPNYQSEVNQGEMRRLGELARTIPIPVAWRDRRGGFRGMESELRKNQASPREVGGDFVHR